MHIFKHTVRLSDTDVTGQVYYARPLEWLEWCRVEWFQAQYGNFMEYVARTGITFFPSRVAVDYKRPLFFGDELAVEMRVGEIKKVSFGFLYTIRRGEQAVLTSEITMVCFDTKKKALAPLDAELTANLNKLKE